MEEFVILPWEHGGASFNPQAHAETRLELGGKERHFLLKLREGVLYFKEPSSPQIFAILQAFDETLATDPYSLISAFNREVADSNYGALVVRRESFPKSCVMGLLILLIRPDGTGWMREHFDTEWFPLPDWGRPLRMNLWGNNLNTQVIVHILPTVKDVLLQRTLKPEIRQAESPRWIGGTKDEYAALLIAATRLFFPPPNLPPSSHQVVLKVGSRSTFAHGGIQYWSKYTGSFLHTRQYNSNHLDTNFLAMMELIKKQFHFVGVNWIEVERYKELEPHRHDETLFQEGLKQWGKNWRGNWAPQSASFEIIIPDLTTQSAHEKLEAALLLRQWLQGRMPPEQIESLFKNANLN